MYLKMGLGTGVLALSVFFWWKWAHEADAATANKLLVVAVLGTVGAIWFFSSKRIGAALKELEAKLEIEEHLESGTGRTQESERASSFAATTVEQTRALADPATAQSLKELEKMLYTRSITEHEYQQAKDKLFVSASQESHRETVEQLRSLAELHETGVLSEVEFTAAKLRLLGLG